jgi:hypothetical protein
VSSPPSAWGRRLSTGVLAGLLATAIVVGAPFGHDRASAQEEPRLELTVSHLTGVLGPGSVVLDIDGSPADLPEVPTQLSFRALVGNVDDRSVDLLRLVTEVHAPVADRDELEAAFDGRTTGAPLHVHDVAIRDGGVLREGEVAGIEERFDPEEIAWPDGSGGVLPIRLAVVRGTTVLTEVVTAVVWLNDVPDTPLPTSVVWPLDDRPWRTADGAYPANADRAAQPGGRIDRLVAALERNGANRVALAPAPHLLEDLEDRRGGFTSLERQEGGALERRVADADGTSATLAGQMLGRIRDVATDGPFDPVAGVYADADLAALRAASPPLPTLAAEAAVDGRRRLQRLLGRSVDASTHLVAGALTPDALDLLPGDVALVPNAVVTPGNGAADRPTEGVRTFRTPAGRLLDVIVSDAVLSDAVATPDLQAGPVIAAQRFVAGSAMAWLEAPDLADRTLLVLPPADWDATPEVLDGILGALDTASWLDPRSPSELAATGRRVAAELTLAAPSVPRLPNALEQELGAAMADLAAVRTALPEDVTTIEGRSPSVLQDQLLRASSRWLHGPGTDESLLLVRDVRRAVDTAFGTVSVVASGVTLTSDTGQIPVTVRRTRGGPVTVQVEVASQGRLLWPEGRRSETLVLPEDGSATVTFPTQALSTGTFPVTVRVTDPSGARELQRTDLSVRSTAISGPALAVIGGAIVLLLLSGALRRRSRPRPPLSVVSTEADHVPS